MKSVEIIVATHKKYEMPKGKYYLPLHVGAKDAEDLGIQRDDTGDNISEKNPGFCELTGLYWGWKNLKCDYIGLVHYRRHFTLFEAIISTCGINSLVNNKNPEKRYDLILPKRRRYYIDTLYAHYKHTLKVTPLNRTRSIIERISPEYLPEFDRLHSRYGAHMFNMFIGRKDIIDRYCKWLFKILFELEKEFGEDPNFKSKGKQDFHGRFYGRISELLFDVWLYTNYPELKTDLENDKIRVKELRIIEIEGTKWLRKISSFLQAKFLGRKYEQSF